ncbi:DUF2325 domain-containing protein [Vallitalea sp.]|uniref:DUF2325 domain-containing protein n=1 Tax=Vallitalea sp. TaxID=1882829 RepID=UPI0025E9B0E4|nr:DUF2325 domain-containing protein [Vallitalea sp.]MCT4686948.1 DUF2325 domain-containing protein [Vallitalea sp.]
MSIVLIGGHDRMHREYKTVCKNAGHKLKVFTQMSGGLSKSIGTPDALLIFTSTVSHKMVKIANKEAKKKNIPVLRCHSSSIDALHNSIKNLESVV